MQIKDFSFLMHPCNFHLKCFSPAVAKIPHLKLGLCKDHFIQNIENRVKTTISEHNLVDLGNPDEKILVAISGGKDSQTLLTILHKVFDKQVKLEALYIEVGITPRNYSRDSEIVARKLCNELMVPFHVLDITEHLGFDLDKIHLFGKKIARRRSRMGNKQFRGDCSYCGLLKRYYINYFAVQNNFTKVATGHNLTDEATQLFSNFFIGDIELMARVGPSTSRNVKGLVDRIKPLYYIYETELILYAFFAKVDHLPTECDYAVDSPMIQMKRALEEIESFRTGTMIRMVDGFQKEIRPIFSAAIPSEKTVVKSCEVCGMTTYLEKCSFCTTTEKLKEQLIKYDILNE